MKEELRWSEKIETREKENLEKIIKETIKRIETFGVKIGEGKAGRVCFIEDFPDVCLKIIENGQISKNGTAQEMEFMVELSAKGFPVPKPLCYFEEGGRGYIFMETVKGFDLKQLVKEDLVDILPKNFNFKLFFEKLRSILEKLHEIKVFHRDLHEGNIMIDEDGNPVIIDFGDATLNYLSSENPYREINPKGELVFYVSDEERIKSAYKEVGEYLSKKRFFEKNQGRRENEE